MMHFQWINHASVLIKTNAVSLITDPWFGFPFHHNTYHSYPEFPAEIEDLVSGINAIHISHIHSDHFCKRSLSYFDKNIPIYISAYENDFFLNELKKIGFRNIILIPRNLESCSRFHDINLWAIESEQDDQSFDSALIISNDQNENFLLQNDCALTDNLLSKLKNKFQQFRGIFFGYTGINPYPTCFDFSLLNKDVRTKNIDEILRLRRKKSNQHIEHIFNELKPAWAVPYANNLRFLNAEISEHNRITEGIEDVLKLDTSTNIIPAIYPPLEIDSTGKLYSRRTEYKALTDCLLTAEENPKEHNEFILYKDKISQFCLEIVAEARCHWPDTIDLGFKITTEKENFEFHIQSENLTLSLLPNECDILLMYPFHIFKKVVDGQMSWRDLHYTYHFKTFIINPKGPDFLPHHWIIAKK